MATSGFADEPIHIHRKRVQTEHDEAIRDNPRLQFLIDLKQNNLSYMKAVAWKGVAHFNTGPTLFRKANKLMELVRDEQNGTTLREVDTGRLTDLVASSSFWFRRDKNLETIEKLPVPTVIGSMLSDPYPPVPPITRIVNAPVFGAGGELLTAPGYNAVTHTYFDRDPRLEIPPVSDTPSTDELAEAVGLIGDDLMGEFHFVSDGDRAHAMSLLLNPFVRDMIPGQTPLYAISAPKRGSGKTLLAHICMIPALGSPGWVIPPTSVEEEMRKRLTGIALSAPDAVCIDNVNGRIAGESFASVITSGRMYDRILGESRFEVLRFRNTWMATLNNPLIDDDFSRRVVQIRLDAKSESPETIAYTNPDIEQWAYRKRGELVWSALTMVRAWIAQGAPRSSHMLNSFNDWAHIHGGILAVANVPGFLEHRVDASAIETDQSAMREFCLAWWTSSKVANVGVKASELMDIAEQIEGFPWIGKANDQRTRLGYTLKKYRDQVFDGFVFGMDTGGSSNSNRWKIERLNSD